MTVFRTFLKILSKNIGTVIMYTSILVIFASFNVQSNSNNGNFIATKPDILIVNNDKEEGITKKLIDYISKNSKIINVKDNESARDDSLFYNELDYIIYIPKGFDNDFMNGKIDKIDIKSNGNFNSSYAEMLLTRYLNIASTYRDIIDSKEILLDKIEETLYDDTVVNIKTKLDTLALERAEFYYNFESYSLLACLIFVICLIMSTFNSEKIRKRTIISSTDYRRNNRILLLSNFLYAFILWLIYLIISFIVVGSIMFSINGLLFIFNSFIFLLFITTLAFFIGNLISSKDSINGIMNVIALGSSFLCGVFVPQNYLPDFVLKVAHLLPTYYYVNANDVISKLEKVNLDTLKPIFINMLIICIFIVIFIILNNIVTKKKRKIG